MKSTLTSSAFTMTRFFVLVRIHLDILVFFWTLAKQGALCALIAAKFLKTSSALAKKKVEMRPGADDSFLTAADEKTMLYA